MIATNTIKSALKWCVILPSILLVVSVFPVSGQQQDNHTLLTENFQEITSFYDIPVSIQIEEASLGEIFNQLEQKMGLRFLYNPKVIERSEYRLDLDLKGVSLADVLTEVALETGLTFRQVNGTISVGVDKLRTPKTEVDEVVVQQTVTGTVLDAQTGDPLPGVNVVVAESEDVTGSIIGATTNADGYYEIQVPDALEALVFTYIGYQREEIQIEGRTTIDVELQMQAIVGNELVVTGTVGDTRKRTLGNSISQIDVTDKLDKVSTTNFTELLQASSPGINISPGSGTAGSSPNITLRGANSINAGNRPVIYVDGVRIHDGSMGNFNVFGQNTTGLDAINPSDIQSVEIIKGPAAATLYGAEASAGVIQIITKRGSKGSKNLQWDAGVEVGQVKWTENLRPTNYAVATEGRINDPDNWPGFQGAQVGDIISHKLLSDNSNALRSGLQDKYYLSTTGGGQNYSFYISGSRSNQEGVFHPNSSERSSLRANFSTNIFEDLDLSVSTSYANNNIQLPLNDNHAQSLILSSWLATPGRQYSNPAGYQYLTISPRNYNTYDNGTNSNRYILGTRLNYSPTSWFDSNLNVGYDFMASKAENYYPPNGPFDSRTSFGLDNSDGLLARGRTEAQELTIDYSGTIKYDITSELRSNLSFGAQYLSSSTSFIQAIGQDLGSVAVRSLGSAAVTRSDETYVEQKSFGIYVQEQLGFRDRLFLTGAVRMDNNSAFGSEINRTFYPKASLSYVISDEEFFQKYEFVDYLKLRAALGQSGNAPGPFDAARTYGTTATTLPDGGSVSALIYDSYGNPNLKPERSTEVELGFEATLFGDLMQLDFTYYNTRTKDALISVPVAPSTGFAGNQLQNLGEIADRGIELSVGLNSVRRNNLTINHNLAFTYNQNEMISFGDSERTSIPFGVYAPVQRFEEGKPLGAFWADAVQYNSNGDLVLDSNGRPVLQDEQIYKGPATPPYKVGFSSTVNFFENFQVYFLLDYQAGHYQFNVKDWRRDRAGLSWATVRPDADPDEVLVRRFASQTDLHVQKADFLKLRELSFSYNVHSRFIEDLGLRNAKLTLSGRNLAIWTKYGGADPEINFHGDETFLRVDSWTLPNVRQVNVALNIGF